MPLAKDGTGMGMKVIPRKGLGQTSLQTSVLGLGTLHFGVYCDRADAERIVHRAIDWGINFIETAPMYGNGNSEAYVGNAIRGRRQQVIISTKVGLAPRFRSDGSFGVRIASLDRRTIRASVEASLTALGTDSIDLLQLHAYDPTTPLDETCEALRELVSRGMVRAIGCSNHSPDELAKLADAFSRAGLRGPNTCQVHYNLLERRAERELIPGCVARGISTLCNRVLARGLLSGKYRPNSPFPPGSRAELSARVRESMKPALLDLTARMHALVMRAGVPLTRVAIAWLLSRPGVGMALLGVRNIEQFDDCYMAVSSTLPVGLLEEIEALIQGAPGVNVMTAPSEYLER